MSLTSDQGPRLSGAEPDDSAGQELTPRQQEILSLLTAGKANKAIAYELGIGVGTVKQHVVALFRKLQVTNRAMAVARGRDFGSAAAASVASASQALSAGAGSDSIELRPVTVLSLACRSPAGLVVPDRAWRQLQTAAIAASQGVDSILIGHPGSSVDVILGLHRVDERNAEQALALARALFGRFVADWPTTDEPRPMVQGGIVSGYLLASVGSGGDWTGETVAGRLISHARTVRDSAPADGLLIDTAAQRLIAFANRADTPYDEVPPGKPPQLVRLAADAADLRPRRSLAPPQLIGRGDEAALLRRLLDQLATGRGGVVWVEGETGTGKTALCRAVAAAAGNQAPWQWLEGRCAAGQAGPLAVLSRLVQGTGGGRAAVTSIDDVVAALRRRVGRRPLAVMVDEVHLASAEEGELLLRLIELAQWSSLLLIGVGRGRRLAELQDGPAELIRLGRLDDHAIAALARATAPIPERLLPTLVELASGVPLFARELAWEWRFSGQSPGDEAAGGGGLPLPLSLIALVLSRIEGLVLDHAVLKAVAWQGPLEAATLTSGRSGDAAAKRSAAIERAVSSGVVAAAQVGSRTLLTIKHPLVAAVLRQVMPVMDRATGQMKG